VPIRPPSVCAAGASVTEYGGAIGVMNGEPVVPGPCAEVTTIPSFVIVATFFFSASAMLTEKRTWIWPGAPAAPAFGTVRFDHTTRGFFPPTSVPPLSADTKLVLAGIGSEIVTPVASALPTFLSVNV
jgi:hypothetical protein